MGIDQIGAGRRLRAWLTAHLPELAILAFGALLRVSMATGYDGRVGFDFNAHWPYIDYIVSRHALPPMEFNTATYHPPLYYLLCAQLIRAGLDVGALGWMAAILGIVRLSVTWVGLERWLPESRLARVIALATAAVIPASLQLDGMISNETLFTLFCALALVAAPSAIRAARTGALGPMVWLTIWLGLALITKVSALVILLAVMGVIALEIVRRRGSWAQALRDRARALIVGGLIVGALSGWFFVRNQVLYGQLSPTGYDGWAKKIQAPFAGTPYLDRRTLGFFAGFDPQVFVDPYAPTGYTPHPRFFSVLLASTFCDFYNYSLFRADPGAPTVDRHHRSLPKRAVVLGGWSVRGGAVVAFVVLLTWIAAVRWLWRRPTDSRLVLLFVPALALFGQLHFATKYPNDAFGPIKGTYLQFAAPVACGLFGVGVSWMWRRTWARWGALLAVGALGLVAIYTCDARRPRATAGAPTAAPFWQSSRDGGTR